MKQLALALFTVLFPLLLPALPTQSTGFEDRLRDAVLAGDQNRVLSVCREWYKSGQYSPGILNWNYNALMSVEPGSLLITQNDHDTYPAMLLQYALDVRQDVGVLNIGLLENDRYRKSSIDKFQLRWIPAESNLTEFMRRLLQPDWQFEPVKPVYFSVMLDKSRFETEPRNVYITGLALKYSRQPFDNLTELKSNFENLFRTDYLKLDLAPETNPEMIAKLNMNYIPAFLLLYRQYNSLKQHANAEAVKDLALTIGHAGDRTAEIESMFTAPATDSILISAMTPKSLERGMMKVNDRLYAAETELSNSQYELFLEDLVKNKAFDQVALCRTTKTDWRALLPKELQSLPDAEVFKNGHPDAPDCPVQNISYEAARQYCDWITRVYNSNSGKKKYRKVVFRLPTIAEWELAAGGGLKQVAYPWGGNFVRNSKGCYLCNFKASESCKNCPETSQWVVDGGYFPVKASSYFPNRMGLYNMSGNVAEMVQERGKSKGGSWADTAYDCQITSMKEYQQSSPTLGFRVFMEIIEQ
jgi:formylglycine-generating enzyme required for sulfatase activity